MKRSLKFLVFNLFVFFNMCDCELNRSMDIKTPRNVYLSAFYKRSFAFFTVKNRMPLILTNIIDNLVRSKTDIFEEFGEDAREELKTVIGALSEFKYEVQTNKPVKNIISKAPDAQHYNDYIEKQSSELGPPTHFHTIWLLTECYMYRRVRQIFEETNLLQNYDPFCIQKEETFNTALPFFDQMGQYLTDILEDPSEAKKDEFISLIKLNVWGNKCDLSLSLGKVKAHSALFDTHALDQYILSDSSESIWQAVSDLNSPSQIIDVVLDNTGYELFTDLCLADYILSKNLAQTVRYYVKTIPWFISDVMSKDFHWTIDQLKTEENPVLQALGNKWYNYVLEERITIVESDFWTLPFDFTYMEKVNPDLYKQISEAKVVFFKGDLNYRKLFGEKNWDPVTPVNEALQDFHPTTLCILRTIKSDIICGLKEGEAERAEAQEPTWMTSGNWGVIQFSPRVTKVD